MTLPDANVPHTPHTQAMQDTFNERVTNAFNDAKAAGAEATDEVRRRRARKSDTAADLDTEMKAINACVAALNTLDAVARQRVMLYLVRRYDVADVTGDE